MRFLILTLVTLPFLSVSAQEAEKVSISTQTKRTGKEIVLAVGECVASASKTGSIYNSKTYTVSYSVCKEYVSYEVETVGSSWDSESSVVPGSESAPFYKTSSSSKSYTGNVSFDGSLGRRDDLVRGSANVSRSMVECENKRETLERKLRQDRGSAMYNACRG